MSRWKVRNYPKETREQENKDVFFLQDSDLKPRKLKQFQQENDNWRVDLCGHGAIDWFYPDIKGKGAQKECTDFTSPNNFPKEIVKAIKQGKMKKIGFDLGLLNEAGKAKYKKIEQSAWADYEKIRQSAFWKIFMQKKYRTQGW